MPTYKQAVKAALVAWDEGFFRWRSSESKAAVDAINTVIGDPFDDRLLELVNYLTGVVIFPPSFQAKLQAIGADSKLRTCLNTALAKADKPRLAPKVTTTQQQTSHQSLSSSSSSSSAVRSSQSVHSSATSTKSVAKVVSLSVGFNYANLEKYQSEWSKIKITDLPTDTFGVYKTTDEDKFTIIPRGTAAGKVLKGGDIDNASLMATFWVILGGMVMKKKGDKYGRCLDCAAAVVYTLVSDETYDALVISVMGKKKVDHHFVYVGTPEDLENDKGRVIDVWDANLNKQSSSCSTLSTYKYGTKGWKPFCTLLPKDRSALREEVLKLNGKD